MWSTNPPSTFCSSSRLQLLGTRPLLSDSFPYEPGGLGKIHRQGRRTGIRGGSCGMEMNERWGCVK